MSANAREISTAVSKRRQSALATPNVQADFIQFIGTNDAQADIDPVNEDDAADYGKGHEFATTDYPSHWNAAVSRELYLKAEVFAWVTAMGLGNCVKSGSSPAFTYTCTPSDPISAGIDLPPFTYAEAIRAGASPVWDDKLMYGCVINAFNLSLASGPGRESTKLSVEIVGTGRHTVPSGLDFSLIPIVDTPLPSYSASVSILGTNYATNGRIIGLEFGWNNNVRLDSGFYPGSGKQGNHQVRGRMEHGDRACTLSFTARLAAGQAERTALENLTTGTAVINIPYNANNETTITCHKVSFAQVQRGNTDGIVHIQGTLSPKMHPSNGLLTVVTKCGLDDIFALSA